MASRSIKKEYTSDELSSALRVLQQSIDDLISYSI